MHTDHQGEWTRRRVLSAGAAGLACAALSRGAWAASASIPTGIQLYTVGADLQKDPAGTLKKVAAIGYTTVETAGLGKLTAAQLHDLIQQAGLRAPSAHLNFGMADTGKLLDDAKALGAEYAVSSILLPGPPPAGAGMGGVLDSLNKMSADDFKKVAAFANQIAQKAKAAGLQYAYHNHNFEFRDLGNGHTGYDILLHETDSSLVKFEADTGWMRVAGVNPVTFLKAHADRFAMLHIKDFKNLSKPVTALKSPDAPTPTELGRGSVDVKSIVKAGRDIGVKYMFVEQEPPFTEMPDLQAAAVDYQVLHPLLSGA